MKTQTLISGKFKMPEIIDYSEGSIVSKTLINKKAGTVTLFSFDKDQSLSEHTATYDALVHLVDGNADIIISGIAYPLEAGESIILPGGEPHAVKATEKFKMLLTMIKQVE